MYVAGADQGGLTMPDREYCLAAEPRFAMIRDGFRGYVGQLLKLAGADNREALATRVLALETRLAQAQWTKVQLRDPIAVYNKFAAAKAPGLDWLRYLDAAGVRTAELVVGQPSFFTTLGSALTQVPLEDWKAYLKFSTADEYAPNLGAQFVDANFASTTACRANRSSSHAGGAPSCWSTPGWVRRWGSDMSSGTSPARRSAAWTLSSPT